MLCALSHGARQIALDIGLDEKAIELLDTLPEQQADDVVYRAADPWVENKSAYCMTAVNESAHEDSQWRGDNASSSCGITQFTSTGWTRQTAT